LAGALLILPITLGLGGSDPVFLAWRVRSSNRSLDPAHMDGHIAAVFVFCCCLH
jgi:hypothetical protein